MVWLKSKHQTLKINIRCADRWYEKRVTIKKKKKIDRKMNIKMNNNESKDEQPQIWTSIIRHKMIISSQLFWYFLVTVLLFVFSLCYNLQYKHVSEWEQANAFIWLYQMRFFDLWKCQRMSDGWGQAGGQHKALSLTPSPSPIFSMLSHPGTNYQWHSGRHSGKRPARTVFSAYISQQ